MRRHMQSSLVLARTLSARVEGFERTLPAHYQVFTTSSKISLPGIH
jgi:hypothetical protein